MKFKSANKENKTIIKNYIFYYKKFQKTFQKITHVQKF